MILVAVLRDRYPAHQLHYEVRTKERLELFIKVCQAIQHAHQKGVMHRDIKPSIIQFATISSKAV